MKFLGIIALVAAIGFSIIGCDNGAGGGTPNPGSNQTPVAGDYNVGNLSQTAGSVTAVSITAKSGKSPGAVYNIRYNSSSAIPQTAGQYSIIFDVGAAAGWNTATDLFAGTLIVGGGTPPTPTHSLNGIWQGENGRQVTVSGSTGINNTFGTPTILGQDAINKDYWKLGDQHWRNLTSTGTLTWTGQHHAITYNTSSPNVAIGTTWVNAAFTLSADGQTLTVTAAYTSGTVTSTWIRSSYSLNGIWQGENGRQVTVSGSTGINNTFGTPTILGQDAINKGYWKLGDQHWRNLNSTGTLTWTGQHHAITYNTSSPNVAIGTTWVNAAFTLSADGQTLTVTANYTSGTVTSTWIRKQ